MNKKHHLNFEGFPNATIEWKWNDRPIRELNDPNLQIEGNGPRSDLLIIPRERRYYTAYKCVAKNRLGTAEHLMELREARIPDVIPQAKSVVVTATSITFEILSPPYDPGLPITAFAAQYKDRNEPDWTNAYNRSWSPDSKFTVEGLRPQTFYDFRFAALNKVGLSQWGAYVAQATPGIDNRHFLITNGIFIFICSYFQFVRHPNHRKYYTIEFQTAITKTKNH